MFLIMSGISKPSGVQKSDFTLDSGVVDAPCRGQAENWFPSCLNDRFTIQKGTLNTLLQYSDLKLSLCKGFYNPAINDCL